VIEEPSGRLIAGIQGSHADFGKHARIGKCEGPLSRRLNFSPRYIGDVLNITMPKRPFMRALPLIFNLLNWTTTVGGAKYFAYVIILYRRDSSVADSVRMT